MSNPEHNNPQAEELSEQQRELMAKFLEANQKKHEAAAEEAKLKGEMARAGVSMKVMTNMGW